MKNKKIFECPKNEAGFVCYSNRSNNEIEHKNLKELFEKVLIPLSIENDKRLLKKI